MSGSTLGCVTAIDQPAPSRTGGVALDAKDLARCRRRIHLDHDPDAVGLPRALPDPSLEQRRADAARHRAGVAAVVLRETGCFVIPADADAERITAEAVAEGAALIWGALLPAAPGTRRAAGRSSGARARGRVRAGRRGAPPDHRSGGGRGHVGARAAVAARGRGRSGRAGSGPTRATCCGSPTCTGCCGRPGWAPARGRGHQGGWGGVIGFDADAVVWHDLWAGHWPGGRVHVRRVRRARRRSHGRGHRSGRAGARAGAAVADHRVPPLPVVAHLRAGAHPRGGREPGRAGRGGGSGCARRASPRWRIWRSGIRGASCRCRGVPVADTVALARAWLRELPVVRRVPRVPVRRADVEVDVDMESFGESGAYLWGALLTYPGGASGGRPPGRLPRVRHLGSAADARRGALVRGVLGVAVRGAGAGRRVRPQLRRLLLQRPRGEPLAARRPRSGSPGGRACRRWRRWRSSSGIRRGSTSTPSSTSGSSARTARVSSASPPRPGSAGATPRRVGRTRCAGTATPSAWTARSPDPAQRRRLLEYNADDVAATHALREWMTSPGSRRCPWPPTSDVLPARPAPPARACPAGAGARRGTGLATAAGDRRFGAYAAGSGRLSHPNGDHAGGRGRATWAGPSGRSAGGRVRDMHRWMAPTDVRAARNPRRRVQHASPRHGHRDGGPRAWRQRVRRCGGGRVRPAGGGAAHVRAGRRGARRVRHGRRPDAAGAVRAGGRAAAGHHRAAARRAGPCRDPRHRPAPGHRARERGTAGSRCCATTARFRSPTSSARLSGTRPTGFPLVAQVPSTIGAVEQHFREHWPSSAATWLPDGRVPTATHRLPALAATWRRLLAAAVGPTREAQIDAARDAWYRGFVAEEIERFVATPVRDATGPRPRRPAHRRRPRGLVVLRTRTRWSSRSAGGGRWPSRGRGRRARCSRRPSSCCGAPTSPTSTACRPRPPCTGSTEAAKLAFADREAWYGDSAPVPLAALVSRGVRRRAPAP